MLCQLLPFYCKILYCNIMVILTRSKFNQCKELLEFVE